MISAMPTCVGAHYLCWAAIACSSISFSIVGIGFGFGGTFDRCRRPLGATEASSAAINVAERKCARFARSRPPKTSLREPDKMRLAQGGRPG